MFSKNKVDDEKNGLMALSDRINNIDVDVSDLKNTTSRLDGDLTQSVSILNGEIKNIKGVLESLKTKSDQFDGAIRDTIKAESDEVSKIRVTNGSVSEFRGEIERLSEVIKTMQADISRLDKKEVTIQYDSEVGSLRDDFEKFKKIALTVDDKI
ncbi:MAG: hypothetical protein KAI18_01360 [Candidatus Aenigmarchaeota archaeon]|nr:hypothetical protein [Candidatus Aenigmarchaeota archaeon]